MSVPAPVGHNEEVAGFPREFFAFDFGHAAAFDDIVKLIRGVAVFFRFLSCVEHLNPAGKSRKRRTTRHRIAIFEAFPVIGILTLRQHFRHGASRFTPLIYERLERLSGWREQTGIAYGRVYWTVIKPDILRGMGFLEHRAQHAHQTRVETIDPDRIALCFVEVIAVTTA